MNRPVTTLFMLMSVDGRISTGANDTLDFDQDLQLVSEIDEIKQALMILLKSRKGEFFADLGMGLDQRMLIGKDYDLNYVSSNINNALTQDERVASVIVNKIDVVGRKLYISFVATLENSETIEMEVALDD